MQQQINLYTQIPQEFRKRITLKHMLQMVVFTFVLLVVLFSVQMCSNKFSGWKLDHVIELKKQGQLNVAQLKKKYPKVTKSADLETQLKLLKETLATHEVLLKDLSNPGLSNEIGFVELLSVFAKHIEPHMWLREINIQKGGTEITLNGITQQVSAVRSFIKKMTDDPIFRGLAFKLKRLETSATSPGDDDFSIIILPVELAKEKENEVIQKVQ